MTGKHNIKSSKIEFILSDFLAFDHCVFRVVFINRERLRQVDLFQRENRFLILIKTKEEVFKHTVLFLPFLEGVFLAWSLVQESWKMIYTFATALRIHTFPSLVELSFLFDFLGQIINSASFFFLHECIQRILWNLYRGFLSGFALSFFIFLFLGSDISELSWDRFKLRDCFLISEVNISLHLSWVIVNHLLREFFVLQCRSSVVSFFL